MALRSVKVQNIKAGMVIFSHGCQFRAVSDAQESRGHFPMLEHGPSDVAYVIGEVLTVSDYARGYYAKGEITNIAQGRVGGPYQVNYWVMEE